MNVKRMFITMLAAAAVVLSACSDDEKSTPKNRFAFEGDAISLNGSNLYLVYEGNDGNGHMYREYFVTDGTYENGEGWDLDDYEGATYLMALQIGVPEEEELSPGNYPLFSSFGDAPQTSNIAWLSFETADQYYYTPEGVIVGDAVVLAGSFDDGDTMTIKFTGALEYDDDDSDEEVEGSFLVKGKVEDLRSPASRTAASNRGAKAILF